MSSSHIEGALVAYHFGVVPETTRQQIEAHLPDCRPCLEAFLAIKREVETAPLEERPSDLARARLRRAVEHTLHGAPRPWSWWERPLAFGIAGAAVMGAMFAVQIVASGEGSAPRTLSLESRQAIPNHR